MEQLSTLILFVLLYFLISAVAIYLWFEVRPSTFYTCKKEDIPVVEAEFFQEGITKAQHLGFEFIGYLSSSRSSSPSAPKSFYLAALSHQPTSSLLILLTAPTKRSIELICQLPNKYGIHTTHGLQHLFPVSWIIGQRNQLNFSQEKCVYKLFEKHQIFCEWIESQKQAKRISLDSAIQEHGISLEKPLILKIAEFSYQHDKEIYQSFCHLGYFQAYRSKEDRFRLSWKGAIILTFRSLFPFKQLISKSCDRYYNTLWRKVLKG